MATLANDCGDLACRQGQWDEARDWYELSRELYQCAGMLESEASTTASLGNVAQRTDDSTTATQLCEKVVRICRGTGGLPTLVTVLEVFANVTARQGNLHGSLALLTESIQLRHAMESRLGIAPVLEEFAGSVAAVGNPEAAIRVLALAARLRNDIDTPIPPVDRVSHQEKLARLRAAVDQEAFQRIWDSIQSLNLEQSSIPDLVATWCSMCGEAFTFR